MKSLRIGIDVGGTHTDAVLMDGDAVIAATKAVTTSDVRSGIIEALEAIVDQSRIDRRAVAAIMIGTTQFTNAVVERRNLSEVAAIRIGLPSGEGLPPKVGWPADISGRLGRHVYQLRGGYLYDGSRLADMDEGEITRLISDLEAAKVSAVAISSTFSPMNPEPEIRLAERLRQHLPQVRMTLSHEIGRLGILERENAALLNASLLAFANRVVESFEHAVGDRGFDCRFFISQNDGTLMDADFARAYPALTFASGPTNSLRGACRLTGLDDAIVIDIGGTTSDIGILRGGFPRESATVIEVGGVRTNFRMPDILAIGLGGGSVVSDGGSRIGPESVGHELVSKGLVFGGDTLTATDVIVAAGCARIGDPARVAMLDRRLVETAVSTIRRTLEESVEKMRPSAEPLPVVLVGGGSVLVSEPLSCAARTVRPENSGVANAIGAAIAQIGGEAERLIAYDRTTRRAAVDELSAEATALAVAAGADRRTIRVAEIDETSVSYMGGNTMRLRIKVVGEIGVLGDRRSGTA